MARIAGINIPQNKLVHIGGCDIDNNLESKKKSGPKPTEFAFKPIFNEDELKTKLEETLGDMHKFFDQSGNDGDFDLSGVNLPDADEMHGHINDMMGGKIGLLAKEIAEEVSGDLNIDPENISSTDDVFKKLLKDPSKLMNLVKSIGGKLEDKIKSGDIKQSELLEEASDVMKKMKNMPGMKNMENNGIGTAQK